MSEPITFFVPGKAAPGGSKRAVVGKKTGKIHLVDMGKGNAKWKKHVARVARQSYPGEPLDGPLAAEFHFVMARPKKHYRTGKHADKLRDDAPYYHTTAPDLTKLIRAAEDSLKGICWTDDCRVTSQGGSKTYGPTPGVQIVVRAVEP